MQPIGIIWNMNNKRLEPKSDPRYTIREEILPGGVVSDLSIRRTERADSALFTCVATNAFGSDDTSINMIIQGKNQAHHHLANTFLTQLFNPCFQQSYMFYYRGT